EGEANRQRDRAETQKKETEKNAAEARRQRDRERESFRDAHQLVHEFCLRLSEEDLRAYPGMQPLRKKLLKGGLTYLQRFVDRNQGDPELREELANTLFDFGLIANAVGAKQEALQSYERSLALYRELLKKVPDKAEWKHQLVSALINLGNLQHDLGRDGDKRESLRQARELIAELDGNDPRTKSKLAG